MNKTLINVIRRAINRQQARELLRSHGVPLGRSYHTLSSSDVEGIVAAAKAYGYRKSKNAPGSTARMFYEFANRGHKP